MQEVLHIRTTVQPGGKVEIVGPEHRLFQTAKDEAIEVILFYFAG